MKKILAVVFACLALLTPPIFQFFIFNDVGNWVLVLLEILVSAVWIDMYVLVRK